MSGTVRSFVGVGSNLGDREAMLRFALDALGKLSGTRVIAVSRVYETEPVGPGEQGPYLNAAIELATARPAEALLADLLAIELRAGRDRQAETERWAARTLDLDLLLFGDVCIESPGLSVPHPRLHERAFVLVPLCDLAPDFMHPTLRVSLGDLAQKVKGDSGVRTSAIGIEIPD